MDLRAAFNLAEDLISAHGLHDWSVEFDNAKRRAGICRPGDRTISLSAPLTRLHPATEVRDTILHEIAHALVSPGHAHDEVWAAKAREIGCSAMRCVSDSAPRVAGGWLGVCPAGHAMERHRRPERVASCPRCHDGFSMEHVYEWTFRGRPAQLHPNYYAELERIRSGEHRIRLRPGATARITAAGDLRGRVGRVLKEGRTSYHLQLPEGVVRVIFAAVEPV